MKVGVWVLLGSLLLGGAAIAEKKSTIQFKEGYVNYDTRNGATEIILYEYAAAKDVDLTTNGVAAALGLEGFAVADVMFSQEGPKAMRVLARAENFMMNSTVEKLFTALVGAPARVALDGPPPKMNLNLYLPKTERFYVGEVNATDGRINKEETEILLTFDIADKPISIVFGWEEPESLLEKADAAYQRDADIFRARHLKYYAALLKEFHEKAGRYPLQGEVDYPNYVYLAAPHQEKYVQGTPPYTHKVTPLADFRKELEKGLGRKVDLKFDPQKVPVAAPNFYIYMMDGDTFYLATHLYNARSYTKPLGKHYHKVEIMNGPTQGAGLWNVDDLMSNKDFIAATTETPAKEEFFLGLEKEFNGHE